MKAPQEGPLTFLVGCGRSGTTLLTVMLDSHPDFAIPGESGGFILRFCERDQPLPGSAPFDEETLRSLVRELMEEHRFRAWAIGEERILAEAHSAEVSSRTDLIRSAYRTYAAVHGKGRYGDKTPDHVMHMATLAELFPYSRFVHLIRDGRDVALAMRDTTWAPKTVEGAALHWAQRVRAGRQAGALLGPERYVEARYELLVTRPEDVLRELCAFVGLDFDDRMLSYGRAAGRQLQMSPAPEEDASLRKPPTPGLRSWRTQMSREDARTFGEKAGSVLAELGYEPE